MAINIKDISSFFVDADRQTQVKLYTNVAKEDSSMAVRIQNFAKSRKEKAQNH